VGAHCFEVDIGPAPAFLGRLLPQGLDLRRAEQPRFGAAGDVTRQLIERLEIPHVVNSVDFRFHDPLDAVGWLLILNSDAPIDFDDGDTVRFCLRDEHFNGADIRKIVPVLRGRLLLGCEKGLSGRDPRARRLCGVARDLGENQPRIDEGRIDPLRLR
jgi:hypothetical protein